MATAQQQQQQQPEDPAEAYEAEHVHAVYEQIAPHFSATRHKPWPVVAAYLGSRPAGAALGLDVGCGNGKYLPCAPPAAHVVACDRSPGLVRLARRACGRARHELLVADGLRLPFPSRRADFAVCVAVVHHLSTRDRRVAALRELLRCLRPPPSQSQSPPEDMDDDDNDVEDDRGPESGTARHGGTVLVFVWALEQATSRRGWADGGDQDLLVPWVMKGDQGRETKKKKKQQQEQEQKSDQETPPDQQPHEEPPSKPDQTFQRYYHLYRKGELEEDIAAAGGRVLSSGYDRDNWWAIAATASSP